MTLGALQLPLFAPVSDWKAPSLSELPSWAGAKRIAIDVETCDPKLKELGPGVRRGAFICGTSFSIEDGGTYYLPTGHFGGENLPRESVFSYLRDNATVFEGTLVLANASYDLDFLLEANVPFPKAKVVRDVLIADPLINELHDSYDLDSVLIRWGFSGKDEALLRASLVAFGLDSKNDLWKLPAAYVGPYAERDTSALHPLLRKQERAIEEQHLESVYDLESDLTPVLVRLRRRGIRIDQHALAEIIEWSKIEEQRALDEIHRISGVRIGLDAINTKGPLVQALKTIGISLPKTETGQDKLDRFLLNEIKHPIGEAINRAKKVNKLRTTFAQSVLNHMVNGRVHCTFNQLRKTEDAGNTRGARFGRLSSSDPNLQQQPSRDDFAKRWRSIYVPDRPGQEWLSADYSQQEPRWLTHYAEILRLPGASIAAERYRSDPNTDNHKMMAEICGIPRDPAKIIFLGLCYGMGGAKLAQSLGLPTVMKLLDNGKSYRDAGPEAQSILDQFNQRAPYVKKLAKFCEEEAKRRGWIKTVLGRRCRFPRLSDQSFDWTHKAGNRLIQGSSADQTKRAMIDIDRAGLPIQLQVHDEVGGGINDRKEALAIGEIMRTCVPSKIPFRVDLEVGTSWGTTAGI